MLYLTKIWLIFALTIFTVGCSQTSKSQISSHSAIAMTAKNQASEVVEVKATGQTSNYTFAVTIKSPDTGCDRYADWWEVITPEGDLLYRRVLLHSHVDEQPFSRTGGTVAITPEQEVIVRMHMSDSGYSAIAQQGTVNTGFEMVTLTQDFAANLESSEPLPQNCAF